MDQFDPRVRAWFEQRFEQPTDIQAQAWPRIAAGEHVLLTAPTGSGKTLTAFLWALNQLATGAWERGKLRVLYVSPQKALNTDISRNLLTPLRELELSIAVATRSGDTPTSERRRMLRRPPEILATTPESLNLLLSSLSGRRILGDVRTLILDEIHAVAGNKRGAFLMTAVERLAALSGEFQRIALSATVRPLETVAAFVGGYLPDGTARPVTILRSRDEKRIDIAVCATPDRGKASPWPALTAEFRQRLEQHRSTLLFVNNRALSERLVLLINEGESEPVAYAHHGSLSREIRTLVEHRLKEGELKAIVATSSLELGIDIGSLDEVLLVQTPRTIHSAVQRVGRAGHGVGETSRGRIYPTYARDFLDAAVLAPLVVARQSEAVQPVRNALDILAQVLLSMCGVQPRPLNELYALLRQSWSYASLTREAFDRVVAMLRGRYADTRIRELRPRLRLDEETQVARARDGVLPLVWRSGGVIPDRGYFTIRIEGDGGRLGELDEEFVWERRLGDRFSIGAQTWRIERITRNDVIVSPVGKAMAPAPFWRAEQFARDYELCERVGVFLEAADRRLAEPALREGLLRDHHMQEAAADALLEFLHLQVERTGRSLPHRWHLLVEHFRDERPGGTGEQVILHACWGGRVLRPWAMALQAAWEETHGVAPDVQSTDDGVLVNVPESCTAEHLLGLVTPQNVEALVRRRLEHTGLFGARFRENAARALLLPRHRAGQRMPLWLNRLRAKKLLQVVGRFPDFPIIAETWRTCLDDEFDLACLKARLEELDSGRITVSEAFTSSPSPFAEALAWHGTNTQMYEDDTPEHGGSSLSEQALREVLHDAALRPRLDAGLVAEFEAKLQRTAPDYAPDDDDDWLDLVEERLLVRPWTDTLPPGLATVAWGGGWVVSKAQRPRLDRARAGDDAALAQCLAEYLRCWGPVPLTQLARHWEVDAARIARALERLGDHIVADRLTEGADELEFCDRDNLERLLRLTRAAARPVFEALPLAQLPLLLATRHGLVQRGTTIDDLRTRFELLFGYGAPAAAWESALLPARMASYDPAWLDALLLESDLQWFGAGRERVAFGFRQDTRLYLEAQEPDTELFADTTGRYEFFELQKRSGLDSADLTTRLWTGAWDGRYCNDTFAAVRKGIENHFEPAEASRGRGGWQSSRPLVGSWRALARPAAADALEHAEDQKERARLLLSRYGVLCRALCAQELPQLRWGRLLRALRLMELGGEVLAGRFFENIEGLQFASHEAFRLLQRGLDKDAVYWINAIDPASLCGQQLLGDLPPRIASTWLVYQGEALILVARKNGADVEVRRDTLDPRHLALFGELLRNRRRITIETIDGKPAATSEHTEAFKKAGFYADHKHLTLERSY